MELASPVFPSLFLTLACLGSIARAITGQSTTESKLQSAVHTDAVDSLTVAVTSVAQAV